MAGLDRAYALRENPFSLDGLPADIANDISDQLLTAPLQIFREARLLPYYCDEVYPRKAASWNRTPYQVFEQSMRDRGYNSDPKTLDPKGRSRVTLIRGPRGTGKTTLAHRMMRFLQDCDAGQARWKYQRWSPDAEGDNALRQAASLVAKFQKAVLEEGEGRFLCLLDDVVSGAENDIFQIFQNLLPGRVLFFFITSRDPTIRTQSFNLSNPAVVPFDTATLTADNALAYCKKRLDGFRCAKVPGWLAENPFFPFTSENIRRSLLPTVQASWDTPGSVALRELNVKFSALLEEGKDGLVPAFDILKLSAAEAAQYVIDPSRNENIQQAA